MPELFSPRPLTCVEHRDRCLHQAATMVDLSIYTGIGCLVLRLELPVLDQRCLPWSAELAPVALDYHNIISLVHGQSLESLQIPLIQ